MLGAVTSRAGSNIDNYFEVNMYCNICKSENLGVVDVGYDVYMEGDMPLLSFHANYLRFGEQLAGLRFCLNCGNIQIPQYHLDKLQDKIKETK